MQPLRQWTPPPSHGAAVSSIPATTVSKDALSPASISGKDISFCAEFAVHGGVAASAHGFKAETEMLRMQQAGLLDLVRDPEHPFAVIRVTLSAGARRLLSGERHMTGVPTLASLKGPALGGSKDPVSDSGARRNGFEVARGMIGAAIKAELSFGMADLDARHAEALETRLMKRISQIQVPF